MVISELLAIILDRKEHPAPDSYTSSLFLEGLPRIAQKVGEEGIEVVVAALAQDHARLVEEIADLTFHVLVLMVEKGVTPENVVRELEQRRK